MSIETFDIVVVGSGFAGLSAAIEAKIAGCSVIVIEKMRVPGGNSAISGGLFAVADSPLQTEAGIIDSPDRLINDMLKAGHGLNNPDLIRTVANKSSETFLWTQNYLGVKFDNTLILGDGHSVPRICNTTSYSGSVIIQALLVKCRELKITIRTQCSMNELIKDETNKVVGVTIATKYVFPQQDSGTPSKIMARKAVVLASGGYCQDIQFRMANNPLLNSDFESTNHRGATAEGLISALKIGAMPVHLSWIQMGPWTSCDEYGWGVSAMFTLLVGFPYGIMIDANTGKRFINELTDRLSRSSEMSVAGRRPMIVVSEEAALQYTNLHKCLKRKVVNCYNSVEDIAKAHSINLIELSNTIQKYNDSIDEGNDSEFSKPIRKKYKLTPPFYLVRLKPKIHYSNGGVLINSKAQVLDIKSQTPIKGFYAAGEVTGGIHGASRIGGMAICESLVFGRIAGQTAAQEIT